MADDRNVEKNDKNEKTKEQEQSSEKMSSEVSADKNFNEQFDQVKAQSAHSEDSKKVMDQFPKFDTDQDGFLTKEELNKAIETEQDAQTANRLRQMSEDFDTIQSRSNDEWFSEDSGLTIKDLETYRQPVEGVKNLDGIMDIETIHAVRGNEENLRDYKDWYQDNITSYEEAVKKNYSIGPGQIQAKQIEELKNDERYAEMLKDADPYSYEGANKLMVAYFDREAARFNDGAYSEGREPRPRDSNPKDAKRFEDLQKRWDAAKSSGDNEAMRKLLIESYNSGDGSRHVARVEAVRKDNSYYSPTLSQVPSNPYTMQPTVPVLTGYRN